MKKLTKNLIFAAFATSMLSGCVINTEMYQGKELNPEAKGIAMVRATPYGCQVLGEAEGKDSITSRRDFYGVSKEKLRDSALNDLRNQAREIVASSKKRITLRIIDEQATCNGGECPLEKGDIERDSFIITGYKVTAQIFECGEKEKSTEQTSSKESTSKKKGRK